MCQTSTSGSEDTDEISSTSSSTHKKSGKLMEPRKIRKPLMEKKRRARINQSLDELKRIVVDAEKLNGQELLSRVNKLEKADILEMTVRYLKRKATSAPQPPPPPSGADVYMAGYRQCVEQVQELLAEQWTGEGRPLQQPGRRMVEHLEACARRLSAPRRTSESGRLSTGSGGSVPPVGRTDSCRANAEEERLVVARRSPARTTEFRDTAQMSMWRPW